ncbi:hypothetical protein [Allohahella sp. A8]|uniref:hypothetical protein n=1 Tax=Allohahella sp. A8 TaxID=3141461 RepID=UPI000C0B9F62|nr:hypothetical protein [Hahellaceae bacterium]
MTSAKRFSTEKATGHSKRTSSAPDAAQALLDTADRAFPGYSAAVHGQGYLDLESALKALAP